MIVNQTTCEAGISYIKFVKDDFTLKAHTEFRCLTH